MRIMICLRSEAVSRAAQPVRYVVRGQTLGCARGTKQLDAMLIPVGSAQGLMHCSACGVPSRLEGALQQTSGEAQG
jgi:hypothetical protein